MPYSEDSYESKRKRRADILNPEKKCHYSCFYANNVLIAYAHLEKNDGISVRPELCGCGYGSEVIALLKTIGKQRNDHNGNEKNAVFE